MIPFLEFEFFLMILLMEICYLIGVQLIKNTFKYFELEKFVCKGRTYSKSSILFARSKGNDYLMPSGVRGGASLCRKFFCKYLYSLRKKMRTNNHAGHVAMSPERVLISIVSYRSYFYCGLGILNMDNFEYDEQINTTKKCIKRSQN